MVCCTRFRLAARIRSLVFLTVGLLAALLSISLPAPFVHAADAPPFDLAGPKIDVHVQRAGKTLPIAEVPNLLPGDRLWIHPDLPESQSAHYILIVAFLRGATNPPPADWFKRVETWTRSVREEGVFVVVPAEAQQALIFLAPETIGDFATLRKAVHDRPGAFVRATQDLQQASWDRLRLDAYLAAIKGVSLEDPNDLKEHTALAARSLGIRVDQQCFDKPTEQQAPCLVQHTDGMVMDDSNAQSVVSQMANGSAADMMNQLSYSPLAGGGSFSPYIGAVVDLARILSNLHTAKYQYIPALALPQKEQQDTLNLRLNTPPSFRDPKSVIVVALPPIGPDHAPVLHPPDAAQNTVQSYCAAKPDLVLSVDGAPIAFATALAHDLTLHIDTKASAAPVSHPELPLKTPPAKAQPADVSKTTATATGAPQTMVGTTAPAAAGIDIPIHPNPAGGGFSLDGPLPSLPEDEANAEIRGAWGFDTLDGPKFHLRTAHAGGWSVPSSDYNTLITGREDTLHIQGASTLCVSEVQAKIPQGHNRFTEARLAWKSPKPDQLELAVPLKEASPGPVTIAIRQYGLPATEELPLKAYTEAAALDHITLSAGDKVAALKGRRLDEVESADLAGISFTPAALNRVQDFDQLELSATGVTSTLQPGSYSAKVTLRDGRTLHVPTTVTPARPQIELLSKGVQHDEAENDPGMAASVRLTTTANPNDLPLQRRLVFFLRTRVPATFPRSEKVEIAAVDLSTDAPAASPAGSNTGANTTTMDGSFQTTLSFTDGSLMLEDAHTAVAVIDPLARFGSSAFGPIHLRAVSGEGVAGDWVPLGTLVRLPALKDLRCPRSPAKPCTLTGTNLFLMTAVGSNQEMSNAVEVPPEFTGNTLSVPSVARTGVTATLYLRLRDDPDTVQGLSVPVVAPTAPAGSTGAQESAPPSASNGSTVGAATSSVKSEPASNPDSNAPAPH